MDADEALALISMTARADIGELFDRDTGAMLPPHLWPDSIRGSVKSFSYKRGGAINVTLKDGLRACELMAQVGGKLKNRKVIEFDHAAYLAAEPPKPDDKGDA